MPNLEYGVLDGARQKADHAHGHLFRLMQALDAYHVDAAYSIETERDGDWRVFRLRVMKAPPLELSLIMGDVVHNLRAALDYVVYALAGDRANRSNSFPICDSSSQYLEVGRDGLTRRDRLMHDVPEGAREEIDRMQPFRATVDPARHPLRLLRRLSNVDKHRLSPPVFGATERLMIRGDPAAVGPYVEARSDLDPHARLVDGTEIGRWRPRRGADRRVGAAVDVALRVAFGEDAVRDDELGEIVGHVQSEILYLATSGWDS